MLTGWVTIIKWVTQWICKEPYEWSELNIRTDLRRSSSFLRSLMSLCTTCSTCSASLSVSPDRSNLRPIADTPPAVIDLLWPKVSLFWLSTGDKNTHQSQKSRKLQKSSWTAEGSDDWVHFILSCNPNTTHELWTLRNQMHFTADTAHQGDWKLIFVISIH